MSNELQSQLARRLFDRARLWFQLWKLVRTLPGTGGKSQYLLVSTVSIGTCTVVWDQRNDLRSKKKNRKAKVLKVVSRPKGEGHQSPDTNHNSCKGCNKTRFRRHQLILFSMVPRSDFSLDKARRELGNGPLRFAAEGERSTEEQIAALTVAEKKCFDSLKSKWEEKHSPFSDDMYLRFARCSPGKEKFNEKASMRVMKQYDKRYLRLTAADLEEQLLSKVR